MLSARFSYTRFVWVVSAVVTTSFMSVTMIDITFYLRQPRQTTAYQQVGDSNNIKNNNNIIIKNNDINNIIKNNDTVVVNNFGNNIDLVVAKERQRGASEDELKHILFWNEAYGSKEYDLGFGRQPFYDNLCPEAGNKD